MKKEEKDKAKFSFDTDFQEHLLQYTVSDKNGHRAIQLYEDTYFALLEHAVVAKALKLYFKKKKRLPQSKAILREQLRQLLMSRDYQGALSADDKSRINKVVTKIFSGPVKGGDDLLESTVKFAQYIKLKDTVEKVNLSDFGQYDAFASEVRKSITIGNDLKEERGTFLIENLKDRQFRRKFNEDIVPTPFNQLNRLTNAGGWTKGSVVVIIGPEKEFKTGLMVNIGKGYMKRKKKTLYIDLENGQEAIALRFEQNLMKKSKKDILSGAYDTKISKHFRKYKRLGGEIHIKRFSAYTTNCTHIQSYIDLLYNEFGIKFDNLIVDYAALLGAISGNTDDTQRISDVYIDIKNLALHNGYDHCWTPHHVIRGAEKRFQTKFLSSDTAKCIDIARHVDAMLGYNRSELDIAMNTARLEIVDQRDGVQHGFALFHVDYEKQLATETSKSERREYQEVAQEANPVVGEVDVKKRFRNDLTGTYGTQSTK